jgi:hypothetical protein
MAHHDGMHGIVAGAGRGMGRAAAAADGLIRRDSTQLEQTKQPVEGSIAIATERAAPNTLGSWHPWRSSPWPSQCGTSPATSWTARSSCSTSKSGIGRRREVQDECQALR